MSDEDYEGMGESTDPRKGAMRPDQQHRRGVCRSAGKASRASFRVAARTRRKTPAGEKSRVFLEKYDRLLDAASASRRAHAPGFVARTRTFVFRYSVADCRRRDRLIGPLLVFHGHAGNRPQKLLRTSCLC